jgi:hypothetical protein
MGSGRYDIALPTRKENTMSDLLEPIEGVTVEQYAQLAAQKGAGISQEDFVKLLAQQGMDLEKFGRVEKGWNDRMSADASATVATAYGTAYASAGAGQFGAAGAAAGGFSTTAAGVTGAPAQGEAPIPFEKYCEIQGAQTAWSATGQDVNAMLQATFNMNATDFSNLSAFFMSQMTADMNMMQQYTELCAKYEAQYKGGGGGGDDDIEF